MWVYVLAPLLGAAAGALVYRWLRVGSQSPTPSTPSHAGTEASITQEETHA